MHRTADWSVAMSVSEWTAPNHPPVHARGDV